MARKTREPAPEPLPLPEDADPGWLGKAAKGHLRELRKAKPDAQLADAQRALARRHGFSRWRALEARIKSLDIDRQVLAATREGDAEALATLLEEHPEKLQLRTKPYDWTLLHEAARRGRVAVVELLLARGLDVNTREAGDDTYAMHWAAAGGHVEVVRRLADAGGDVVGHGDDHGLEVIGWATCWDGCDDDAHRAVAEFLVRRGARHHIFSAISMNLAVEVRRIVAKAPAMLNRRMSRNEDHRMPLHFAVLRHRPEMVALLLELGADPLAVDGSGQPAAIYATSPDADRPVMERIRAMLAEELESAARGHRPPRVALLDMVAVLALGDWKTARRLVRESPELIAPGGAAAGSLHLLAKRNDVAGVRWLLAHGANPNARWAHWDAEVTPLHLAAAQGHVEVVRLLLRAGADPSVRDSKHDSDPAGWAEHFGRAEVGRMLRSHAQRRKRPRRTAGS
jgi:ankyrin repeat protein